MTTDNYRLTPIEGETVHELLARWEKRHPKPPSVTPAVTQRAKQPRLTPSWSFARHTVAASTRAQAISLVVGRSGAGVLDTNVIDNEDGTFTVRYATR